MRYDYAARVARMKSSAIREILKVTESPEIISFAGGLPAPEMFPLAEFREAAFAVMDADPSVLQYSTTEGYAPLREQIVARLGKRGIDSSPDEILVTNGSQQGLDLVSKLILDPGDVVAVESPSYLGALQVFESYEARLVSVRTDEHGMEPDALEEVMCHDRPKLVYLTPTFKNPTGVTIPSARRLRLAELSNRYGVVLIEDDPYGALRYRGEESAPIKSHDRSGSIVYLGSFSKIVAPGLRLGWIVAPPELRSRLVLAKQGADLHTGTLVQRALSRYLAANDIERHVERLRAAYGKRRDVMVAALSRHFPSGVTWTHPDGGMFVWATLPEGVDTAELLPKALEMKVAYVPGEPFFATDPARNCLRLNFSNSTPERIEEGIERLAGVVRGWNR
jgi:2-aminoadipate transaminase